MKNLLEKLAYIELVAGILGAFVVAWNLDGGVYYRDWGLTIGVFCGGIFVTAVGYAILGGFSELLDRVDLIYRLLAKESANGQDEDNADAEQESTQP